MKNVALILIGVFLTFFRLMSQHAETVFLGPEFKQAAKLQFQGILGEDSTTLFTVDAEFGLRKLKSIHLSTFDKHTLQRTGSHPVILRDEDSLAYTPSEIFLTKGIPYILASSFLPNETGTIWKIFQLDNMGNVKKHTTVFTSISAKSPAIPPRILVHEEEGLITVFYLEEFVLGVNQGWSLLQYTSQLDQHVELKSSFPFRDRQIELIDLKSRSTESFVALGKEIKGSPIETDNHVQSNNQFFLFFIHPITRITLEIELALQHKFMKDVQLIYKDNHWMVTGFYGEYQASEETGVYFLKFSDSGELVSANMQPIFQQENESYRSMNPGNFKAIELIDWANGALLLISEKQHREVTPRYDARQDLTAYNELLQFDELLIIQFDMDGKITNSLVIPKFQSSAIDQGTNSSFFTVNGSNQVIILFNDHERNKDRKIGEPTKFKRLNGTHKSYLTTWMINPDFSTQHNGILPDGFNDHVKPSGAYQSTPTTFYLVGEKSNRLRIVRVQK